MAYSQKTRIAQLNDAFRRDFVGGIIIMTAGVRQIPDEERYRIFDKISTYDQFDKDNDPYGEHDFGCVYEGGYKIFWKIDYYDLALRKESHDPANVKVTNRLLTIMLAQEY